MSAEMTVPAFSKSHAALGAAPYNAAELLSRGENCHMHTTLPNVDAVSQWHVCTEETDP